MSIQDESANVRRKKNAQVQRPAIPKEISWLSFNERVLQEADNARNPLLERVKFLGIFSNNLDEFYRVRFARLLRLERERGPKSDIMGMKVSRVIKDVKQRVLRQAELFNDIASRIFRELEEEGILIVDEHRLNDEQARFVREYFQSEVRPRLVPLLCDQSRELPALRDQFIYLAVELSVKGRTSRVYAFIEVPTDSLPRFVILPKRGNDDCVILLEDVIRYCLDETFALLNPEQYRAWTVKITRDAALDIEGDSGDSYLDRVHRGLRKRRTGAPVRMVYDKGLPQPFLRLLVNKMKLERDNNLIPGQRYHNFKDFMQFPKLGRDHLVWEPTAPIIHPALQGHGSVLAAISKRDILLHHPYHGFSSFVELLREAAIDPRVTAIAMTVYRVSPTSSVLNALSNAVRNGKQVTVVIELLARFDEENNLEWVDRLRDEGVEVITGVRGLKVHAKLCLISRREGKHQVRFATIGTGNFHEGTARIYSDHILMTRDPGITQEVMRLFEFFRSNYKVAEFRHLIVSPFKSRSHWRELIHREINNARRGKRAYVWIKLNNLADPKLTKEIYEASRAGVELRLIVRSMNSLVPGVAGVSDGIEAISIVGRYLEHSRFLVFCNDGRPEVFITSGDWLPRNFDERIEVACPIKDPELTRELIEYFELQWADTDNARIWDSALSNQRRPPAEQLNARNSHERIRAYISAKANPTTGERPTPSITPPVRIPSPDATRALRPLSNPSLVIQC